MLQRMLASSDTHFSESAMRERNPLLYQQLVGGRKYFGIFDLPSFSKLIYFFGKKMVNSFNLGLFSGGKVHDSGREGSRRGGGDDQLV